MEEQNRVCVMSNSESDAHVFMEGTLSTTKEGDREYSSSTVAVYLDWKLAGDVSAKAYVGVPDKLSPVKPKAITISAYDYTKNLVENQVKFAKHCLQQIRDAISEVNRVIKESRLILKSRVQGRLEEIQQSAAVMLEKIEETTSENFPVHTVMNFVGVVDDSIKLVIGSLKKNEYNMQDMLKYPLNVMQTSVLQVRETLHTARSTAHTFLVSSKIEKISLPLTQSLSNLNTKLLLLRDQLLEQVSKINATSTNTDGAVEQQQKMANKIEAILNKIGRSLSLRKEKRVAALRASLQDLLKSLENAKDQTKKLYNDRTRKLIANVRKNADDAYTMLRSQSEHLLEFLKDKTKERMENIDDKYNIKEKATKLAAATQARVLSVDRQYSISQKISDTKSKTNLFLLRWGIDVESIFNNVLNKADHYDTTLTGGVGKNVLRRAKQTAEDVKNAIKHTSE